MIGFTLLQWRTDPYSSDQSNQLEFILLCALPLVIISQFASFQTTALEGFIVAILSLLILLPIPLIFCYGINLLNKSYKGYKSTNDLEMALNDATLNTTQNGVQHTEHSTDDNQDIVNFDRP